MFLINGKILAQEISAKLKKKIQNLKRKPGLGVILVGDDPASKLYVSLKEKACKEVGIKFYKFLFSKSAPSFKIIKKIEQLNKDKKIDGILIQLPLPRGYKTNEIIGTMSPLKDVDGFHPENTKRLLSGKMYIEPVLAKTIWTLIKNADPSTAIKGKKALIIGNSSEFTIPLQNYFLQKGIPTKEIKFKDLKKNKGVTKKYDVIVIAVGSANFFKGSDFKTGAIVIDVGINRLRDGKIVGDVDKKSINNKKVWITPVPGGVGPVTVATLLDNVYFLEQTRRL